MRLHLLSLCGSLASFSSFALADVKFTKPAAGASLAGDGTIAIKWEESNTAPLISTFSSYQLFLMAGGNDATSMIQLSAFVTDGDFTTGYTAEGDVTAGLGGETTNAYFLKMISVSKEGGQVINYSDRFTLTGMTGTFSSAVTTGLESISGTDGPATEDEVTDSTATTAAADDEFTVAYYLQTGLTKYAPMQPVPPTKITATTATPLNPTSAYTIATTVMATPSILTTITESQTFSVSSVENTAAAASFMSATATGATAKFLARWRD